MKKHIALLLVALTAGLSAPARVSAAPADTGEHPVSETYFLQEVPVVLSVSRLSQPVSETPSAITVIDREMIRASGFRELADLFRLVPGVYVSYLNGHQPIVSYHGLSDQFSRRMQVLVDGRSVYLPPTGGVDWDDLPLAIEDIERIEVIRGPSAAAHGANSFLGVISIITRHASQDRGTFLSVTKGEKGIGDGVLRYGGNQGALDYRLTLGYRSDDGFDSVNDSQRVQLFNLRADYRLTDKDTLEIHAGFNGGTRGLPGFGDNPVDHPRDARITAHFQQLKWQRMFDANNELSVQFYHIHHKTSDVSLTLPLPLPGSPQFIVDDSDNAHRYDLELQHTFSTHPDWRWVWGGSVRLDTDVSPTKFSAPVNTRLQRVFAHAEWRLSPKLLLNAGAMVEHNDITGTDVSPRIALNYHLTPHDTLRASVSQALRTPVLFEQQAQFRFVLGPVVVPRFISSGGLRPEQIVSREVGYIGDRFDSRLSVDVKVYRDHIGDLIGDTPGAFPRDIRNADAADLTGTETQIRLSIARGTRIIANYARQIINSHDFFRSYSTSAPVNSLSLLAMHQFPGNFSASVGYYQQGDMKALGPGERTDFYRRLDLRLAQAFRAGAARGEVAVVLQNLLNDNYTDFRQDNIFNKRGYLTLRLEF